MDMTLRNKILDTARQELGISESPRGSNMQKYGLWYNINGQPWCAIFVSWVYTMAGAAFSTKGAPKGFHYCPGAFNYWKLTKNLTDSPAPADIILYDWDQNKRSDHTGLFVRWVNKETGDFEAIEGNTSAGSNSNGGQVQLRKRNIKDVQAFVNIL